MAAPGNKRRIPMTVTFLAMNAKPSVVPPPQPRGKVALLLCQKPPVHFYRYLYDTIGADYYWVDRKKLSPEGLAELKAFHGRVLENLRLALNVFTTRDIALARRLVAEKTAIREAEARAADSHFGRLREGRPESVETSSIHMDVIRDLKRINGHLTTVAYPILEAA